MSDSPSAKAAQQIHDDFFQDLPEGFEDNEEIIASEKERIAEYVQQAINEALSDSLRPYRELITELRDEKYLAIFGDEAIRLRFEIADRLEALIKEAGK